MPRALVRGEGGGTRIVAVCGEARRLGVRVGMTLSEARARLPSLSTAIHDAARLETIEASITDALVEVSPRLGRTGDGHTSTSSFALRPASSASEGSTHDDFLLDVTSPADVDRLADVVRDLDLGPATIGVADGAFAAICAAHVIEPRLAHDAQPTVPRRKIVPRRGDASFLAPLPTSLLPGSPETIEALHALGLQTMALVAALPLEGVHARLGEEGRFLVALARGDAPPAVATYVASSEPTTEVDLAEDPTSGGATTLDAVVFALRAACLRLLPPLAARGSGVSEVELVLERRREEGPLRIVLRPTRPEVDPRGLFELGRATLEGSLRTTSAMNGHARARGALDSERESEGESERTFGPILKLRLTATGLVPIEHTGERLAFARRDATVLPLDVALARLRGRFGGDRVVTPVRNEDPRPDGRGVFREATSKLVPEESTSAPPAPTLRERLRAPSPAIGAVILSRAPIPGDPWPIRAFGGSDPRRRRTVRDVTPAERVTSGWWSEPFDLVYRWIVADDGARALFARAAEGGGWKLVGVAD